MTESSNREKSPEAAEDKLLSILKQNQKEAAAKGLTEEKLTELFKED